MTHGPIPRKAIDEAWVIASRRGPALDTSRMLRFPGDILLFTATMLVFIRVKRIRTHASEPEEIDRLFHDAVRELRAVPVHPAVCREIHVLSPWGAWQYFRIDPDRIVEVRANGIPVELAGPGTPPVNSDPVTRGAATVPGTVVAPLAPLAGDTPPGVSPE